MRYALLCALTVGLSLARFIVPPALDLTPTAFLKDAAHLFVGGLIGAALATEDYDRRLLYGFLVFVLIFVECLNVFILQH